MSVLCRTIEMPWHDIVSVSVSASGILIKSGDEAVRVSSYFTGYEKIKETKKENCPKAFDES